MTVEIGRRLLNGIWRTGPLDESAGASLPAGGATGEVLTKASNADGDADWEASGGAQPVHGFAVNLNDDLLLEGSAVAIPYDSVFFDDGSYYSIAAKKFTIPTDLGGLYAVSIFMPVTGIPSAQTRLYCEFSCSGIWANVEVPVVPSRGTGVVPGRGTSTFITQYAAGDQITPTMKGDENGATLVGGSNGSVLSVIYLGSLT
jgi:hypothetical protein